MDAQKIVNILSSNLERDHNIAGNKMSLNHIEEMASKGSLDAKCLYGLMIVVIGRDPNAHDKGFKSVKEASDKGHIYAHQVLSFYYQNAIGTPKNNDKHMHYLLRAAKMGSADARYNFALDSIELYGDENEAFKWMSQAAKLDHLEAFFETGLMTIQGYGCNKNMEKGLKIIEEAHQKGVLRATCALAEFFYLGSPVKKDVNKAADYFLQAANRGDTRSKVTLIQMNLQNEVKNLEGDEIISLLEGVTGEGNEHSRIANYNLALIYFKGLLVPKNNEVAMEYLQEASRSGLAMASELLAQAYIDGVIITRDLSIAKFFVDLAKDQGSTDFARLYGIIVSKS